MSLGEILRETLTSPVDLFLLGVVGFIVYRFLRAKFFPPEEEEKRDPLPPPMKRRDFTLEDMKPYDGMGPERRILVAVDGKVFDVTRAKHLYGKEGPYGLFAGRDASRGLATFQINEEVVKDEFDDISDLTADEVEQMKEWAAQFSEKYPIVGRLLRPGEAPRRYDSETEEEEEEEGEVVTNGSGDSPRKRRVQ